MSDRVAVPPEVLADLSKGARFQPDVKPGQRMYVVRSLSLRDDGVTAVAAHGWPGTHQSLTFDLGEGADHRFADAMDWLLVGSASDPDSPRPAVDDRVLVLDRGWEHRLRVITNPPGVVCDGATVAGTLLIPNDSDHEIEHWALLPAPWTEPTPAPVSETSTETPPRWAVEGMAEALYQAGHYPVESRGWEGAAPGPECFDCSEANEGGVAWPCPVAVLAPKSSRTYVETLALHDGQVQG